MALAAPSHRIHGVFGGPSWSSLAGASAYDASSFAATPNAMLPSSRGRGASLSILAARTASASLSAQSKTGAPATPVTTRPRRSSVRSVPVSIRRTPPPPPPAPITITLVEEDPFADQHATQEFLVQALPPPRTAPRAPAPVQRTHAASYAPSAYNYPTPPRRAPRDDRASRLVASVLLHRASGRPMRRRSPQASEEKTYVKSGLSRTVAVAC